MGLIQCHLVRGSYLIWGVTFWLTLALAGTKYYVEGPDAGKWIANKARSTVGSNFALLGKYGIA